MLEKETEQNTPEQKEPSYSKVHQRVKLRRNSKVRIRNDLQKKKLVIAMPKNGHIILDNSTGKDENKIIIKRRTRRIRRA